MIIFFLGRQPEIGMTELEAVFGDKPRLVRRDVALMNIGKDVALQNAPRLGSIVKVAEVVDGNFVIDKQRLEKLTSQEFGNVDGKITLGVSFYDDKSSKRSSANTAQTLRNILRNTGHSVRLIPNDNTALSTAAVLHNKLANGNPKKVELNFVRITASSNAISNHTDDPTGSPQANHLPLRKGGIVVAKTIYIQDINAYTFRDRSRPKRDARNGMLPPKLAQTMINLAIGASATNDPSGSATPNHLPLRKGSIDINTSSCLQGEVDERQLIGGNNGATLLDPFCGTGVVLQEAALMGLSVYGTDINPKMIEYTKANLDWLTRTHHINVDYKLAVGDATSFSWNLASSNTADDPAGSATPSHLPLRKGGIDINTSSCLQGEADERSSSVGIRRRDIKWVASETYLGHPYTNAPKLTELKQNIANCDVIISKFLANLSTQLPSGSGVCLGVPAWFIRDHIHHLPCTGNVEQYGFINKTAGANLIYHRPDQILGRELLVLQKS